MKIAVLGTGLMGSPMAEQLLKAKHDVWAYNRTIEKANPLKALGAQIAGSPDEAVGSSGCTVLMLTDKAAIDETLSLVRDKSIEGKTVIQMGTILPSESIELSQWVSERKGEYLECPVLGSINEVRNGKLILMAGADPAIFNKWEGLLKCFGPEPVLIGGVGKAAAVKLAFNQLIAALSSAFSLSLGIALRHNVDIDQFMSLLKGSALFAPTFEKKLPRYLNRDYANPNFPAKHLLKDVDLILQDAKSLGLETGVLEGVRTVLSSTVRDAGLAESDYSALNEIINPNH